MTAQQEVVVPVIATVRPALFPYGSPKGKTTDLIQELVGMSGEVIGFRCADCMKTFQKFGSALGHRKKHSTKVSRSKATDPKAVASVKGIINEMERLTRENERLKKRVSKERTARRAAERRIDQIERLFAPRV